MKYLILATMLMSSGLTACNTISRGGTDYLRIDTVPQGAKVTTTIETYESKKKVMAIYVLRKNIAAANQRHVC